MEISNYLENLEKRKQKGIHTEEQDLAAKLWEHYGRKEKFGLFLGLIKRRGKSWAYTKISEIKEYERDNQAQYPIQFIMKV